MNHVVRHHLHEKGPPHPLIPRIDMSSLSSLSVLLDCQESIISKSMSESEDSTSSSSKDYMEWIGNPMDVPSSPGYVKVGTWNVRRGLLTVKSITGQRSTLEWLMDTMEEISCEILAIQEPNCSTSAVRACLRNGFHVYGSNGICRTMWITRNGYGAHVRAIGSGWNGRMHAIALSGKNSSNVILVNYYGIAGSASGFGFGFGFY